VAPPTRTIDGVSLLAAFTHATRVLTDHREQLNALNVFPVPDGDTGTNMAMTMRSALEAANRASQNSLPTAGTVAERFAYGGLMGARGNSGVILSQILRGFASEVEHLDTLDGEAIAAALTNAGRVAYQAVVNPVEGTMLTVIADAARAATASLGASPTAAAVLASAADAAAESLVRTPESLPVLRQAQVVDAGGQGIAYILRALANCAGGNLDSIQIGDDHPVPILANINIVEDDIHGGATGYCTNFIVAGNQVDLYQFREHLGTLGTSAVIVGDRSLFKVHIHTDRPDRVLAMAMEYGTLDRIAIENMERQASEVAANLHGTPEPATDSSPVIIAHTDGPGIAEVLRTMGASIVISSEDEFALEIAARADRPIILLPGSEPALATATEIARETGGNVHVIPSVSAAQAVTALSTITSGEDVQVTVQAMNAAVSNTVFAIITCDDSADPPTWHISTSDGATASGAQLPQLIRESLSGMATADPDIVTMFTGQDATEEENGIVQETLASILPDAEIETLPGHQTSSRYILWFE